MSYTPHIELKKALNSKIKSLNIPTQGATRVEIHSFDTTSTGEKLETMYDVTCIIEAIDNNTSSKKSMEMIETIRSGIDENLSVVGYKIIYRDFELLNEIEEITDTDINIFRQIQRVRFNLIKL